MRRTIPGIIPGIITVLALAGCETNATPAPAEVNPEGSRLLAGVRDRVVPAQARENVQQCNLDEERFVGVDRGLLQPWRDAWEARDAKAFTGMLSGGFSLKGKWGIGEAGRSADGVSEYGWQTVDAGAQDAAARMTGYLGEFQKIEDVKFDAMLVTPINRAADGSYAEAAMTLRFDVRGTDSAGWRRNDRGTMDVIVRKEGAGKDAAWKLLSMNVTSADTVRGEKALFADITSQALHANVPVYQRIEAIRRGGYALAMGDYNNDGHSDMYVGTWGDGVLLQGAADGTFAPAKDSGIKADSLVKSAMFADFDNDGWQDLFLVRFAPADSIKDGKAQSARGEDLVYYRNDGAGKFVQAEAPFNGREPAGHAMPAAVNDFNNDGNLDVYVGYPGSRDFTVLGDGGGQKLLMQGMMMNDGKGGFTEKGRAAFEGKGPSSVYAHSSMSMDYDQDGDADIVVIDDRGGLSPVYQNQGDGTFQQVAKDIGLGNEGFGMGIAAADIDNDGLMDFAMTNVDFVAGHRYMQSCAKNWNVPVNYTVQRGLRMFHNEGNGTFSEITDQAGLDWAGEGLAGAEFVDYNNDGLQDLYVANGLWSGTDEDQDLSSLFVRAYADRVAWGEIMALLSYVPENDQELSDWYRKHKDAPDQHRMESQSTFMRILSIYQGDLQSPGKSAGADALSRPSMAGFQRKRMFRNDGNGHFTEVGYIAGVDSLADGYVIARADINDDGRVDLVLRNGDPGTKENSFAPVQILRNETTSGNSLVLTLQGVSSNRDGVGAQITVKANGQTLYTQMIANNGTAQSEKFVHFGLGAAAAADEVVIRWPSGTTQTLKNVKAGALHVVESETVGAR